MYPFSFNYFSLKTGGLESPFGFGVLYQNKRSDSLEIIAEEFEIYAVVQKNTDNKESVKWGKEEWFGKSVLS